MIDIVKKVNRVVIVGTGFVGTTYAYALINQAVTEELVLIDMNEAKAEGEAMDLNHAVPLASSPTKIWQGDYSDCKDADIICVTAAVSQSEEDSRLSVVEKNTKIVASVVKDIMASGFNGVLLIASNPVDLMTKVALEVSELPREQVIGSGTLLDTSRYVHLLSEYFEVDARNVQGYILGEHGDSQFAAESQLRIGGVPVEHIIEANESYSWEDLQEIAVQARDAAYYIGDRKGPTYYGIGMALGRITTAILKDEHTILPITASLEGEYGMDDVCIGVPALLNREGLKKVYELPLSEEEMTKFQDSVAILKDTMIDGF